MRLDVILSAAGVKCIALLGALDAAAEAGHQFENVMGASGGALVGALLAAGYQPHEIRDELLAMDFTRLTDRSGLGRVPVYGSALSLFTQLGLYDGDYLLEHIRSRLREREIRTFRDLRAAQDRTDQWRTYRLRVTAADVGRSRMLLLPEGLEEFGLDPDELDVALAVRISMSIPFFFKPLRLRSPAGEEAYLVDGGLVGGLPDLHPGAEALRRLLVLHTVSSQERPSASHEIHGPFAFLSAIFTTTLEANQARLQRPLADRSVPIDDLGIAATAFHLNQQQKQALYDSGLQAGRAFMANWSPEHEQRAPPRAPT